MKRCKQCIMPSNTPNLVIGEDGVCNLCRTNQKIEVKGKKNLTDLIKKYGHGGSGPNCIVAFSGGRDSAYGLHYVVKELRLNPIAVSYDWGMITPLGRRNQSRMVAALGVEHVVISANLRQKRENIRKTILAWLKQPDLGMVPMLMVGDKDAEYQIDKFAAEMGIELIFYCRGNELEREEFKVGYCGVSENDPGGVIHNLKWIDKWKVLKYYLIRILTNPGYWNKGLLEAIWGYLVQYVIPHHHLYLWHYIKWDEGEINRVLIDEYGWEPDPEAATTWRIDDGTAAFYNYIYYHLQGFTENDSFRSRQIREGMLTRAQALAMVRRENQPRTKSLKWYLTTVGLDYDQIISQIDRLPHY